MMNGKAVKVMNTAHGAEVHGAHHRLWPVLGLPPLVDSMPVGYNGKPCVTKIRSNKYVLRIKIF